MSYCKVMSGDQCYGCGTYQECAGIVKMHKDSRVNGKGETKASGMTFEIITVEGDYPSKEAFDGKWKLGNLGYKPGVKSADLK
jgi:hypothetical protein